MKFLNGFTVLLIFQLLGEALSTFFELFLSGPVVGMLLLFLCLFLVKKGSAVDESVSASSAALLSHLSLLFVPISVGLILYFDRVSDEWLPLSASVFLGTVVSLVSIAWIMQLAINALPNKNSNKDESL